MVQPSRLVINCGLVHNYRHICQKLEGFYFVFLSKVEYKQQRDIKWDATLVRCIFTISLAYDTENTYSDCKRFYVKLNDVSFVQSWLITVICNDKTMVRSLQRNLVVK